MIKSPLKVSIALIALSLLLCSLIAGCSPGQDFDRQLRTITQSHRFDFVKWEINALGEELGKVFSGGRESTDNGKAEVAEYFANVALIIELESEIEAIKAGNRQGDMPVLEAELSRWQQRNVEIAGSVERVLEGQIRAALSQHGIYNPIDKYIGTKIGFPPVNFKLGRLPHLLVISPRDRIDSIKEVALLPEMTREEMELIEARADALGVSSLVVNLGGLATYPNWVTDKADLHFILSTVGEEWLHQYLAFTPLGFRYLMDLTGIRRDYEIATMNETLAGIVSKEIGDMVYEEYYAGDDAIDAEPETVESEFDFNKEMREIRQAVDDYLARGEIEQAEEFMEQKRQYLATKGYHIRKLNQAYFAFHGTYADSPTSISPIGAELTQLRLQSDSLKDFLDVVAAMTSRQELAESVSR